MFAIEIDGLEELERDWQEARRALSDGLRKGVSDAVNEGAVEGRRTHRYINRTGNAERHTEGRMLGSTPGAAIGEVVCAVPYASFLSNGHGTWKPDPFMGNAYLKAERVALREVDVAVHRAAAILER